MRRCPSLLSLLTTVTSLAGVPIPAGGQAVQSITPVRLLAFGGLRDDPAQDLYRVSGVVRATDGRFVLTTTRPLAVRVHDARGVYQRILGQEGEGPGEYRFGVELGSLVGDVVQVVSLGTRRWLEFELDGTLRREFAVDDAHPLVQGVVLQHGAFSRRRVSGSCGCPSAAVLRRYAPEAPLTFVEALTDAQGRTWRRDITDAGLWHVHTGDDVHRFEVRLPPGIVIHQFVVDHLIGVTLDEDGGNHVEVYRVPLPPIAGPLPQPCEFPPPQRDGVFRDLMIHARNAMTAGEAFHSDMRHYPRSAEEMVRLLNVTEAAELTILHSSEESWAFAISDIGSGAVCVASIGPDGLPGWQSGSIACSSTGGRRRPR